VIQAEKILSDLLCHPMASSNTSIKSPSETHANKRGRFGDSPDKNIQINMEEGSPDTSTMSMESLQQEIGIVKHDTGMLTEDLDSLNSSHVEVVKQVQFLTNIVVKQDKIIQHLNNTCLDLQKRTMSNNVLIHNIPEKKEENTVQVTKNVFKARNLSEKFNNFERAHRKGFKKEGVTRPIIVRFTRQDDARSVIMATRPLKGQRLERGDIKFTPHTPDALRQQRGKLGEIAHLARSADKSARVLVRNDHVSVNDVLVTDDIKPPNAETILMRTQNVEFDMQGAYLYTSTEVNEYQSSFQLYAARVKNNEQASRAYKSIQRFRKAASATHLISAHRLDNGTVGWRDDGDHAMGRKLYNTMKEKKMSNVILFLSRNFGGHHMGKRRFEIVDQLVNEIMEVMENDDKEADERAQRALRGEQAPDDNDDDYITPGDLAWDANAAIARTRYPQNETYGSDKYFDRNLARCDSVPEENDEVGHESDRDSSSQSLNGAGISETKTANTG
jgi:hypothetical protein